MRRRLLTLAGLLLWPAVTFAQPAYVVVRYYHTDALGSVRAVTNQQGVVIENGRHDFMPFGEEVNPTVPPPDKRLFTGKERDQETQFDYFGARYLSTPRGRFTTPDPLLSSGHVNDPQSWNRYAYGANNPLRYRDPLGLFKWATGCDEQASASCKAERDRFRAALANLQRAAAVLDQSTHEAKILQAVVRKLGKEGEGNVRVAFGFAGESDYGPNLGLALGSKVTFNFAAVDSIASGVNMNASERAALDAGVVGHEVRHTGSGPWPFNLLTMHGEHAALFAESVTYEGLQNNDRAFRLWRQEWLAVDRPTLEQNRERAIQAILHPQTPKIDKEK